MTKNLTIIDAKPNNGAIKDAKPGNKSIVDAKPENDNFLGDFGTEQFYTIVLGAGMATGMVGMTYPQAITISSSYSP